MDEEEIVALSEALQKATKARFDDSSRKQIQCTTSITDRLNDLGKTIEAIKLVVDRMAQVTLVQDSPGT